VVAAKSSATRFSDLPQRSFTELHSVVCSVERVLQRAIEYEKVNYLMLMMVDPHVHFHVIPRYDGERSSCGVTIADAGWPKAPDLGSALQLDPTQGEKLVNWLRELWSVAELH
jgi:diadenosine tetraphosphate (Ap4A) HIT family hydrolase